MYSSLDTLKFWGFCFVFCSSGENPGPYKCCASALPLEPRRPLDFFLSLRWSLANFAPTGLELVLLLPLTPNSLDYRHLPPCPGATFLKSELQDSVVALLHVCKVI
jgi:hypothetical protein